MRKLLFAGAILLTSCGVYNSSFDCPPGKGIGCTPVHEVVDLIVEKSEGEDVFVKDKGTALLLRIDEERKLIRTPCQDKKKYYLIQDEKGDWKLVKSPKEKDS